MKHLKQRKRGLLTDTLKELRQMGIRSNVDHETVSRQASTSQILSKLPTCAGLSISEKDFFAFLDHASAFREASKHPSEDLSSAETSKCVGLLEGLLSLSIRQRQVVADFEGEMEACDSLLAKLFNMWQPEKYAVLHEEQNPDLEVSMHLRRIRWLRMILASSAVMVTKLSGMAHSCPTNPENELLEWSHKLSELDTCLHLLPKLGFGLATSDHIKTISKVKRVLAELSADLEGWMDKFGSFTFILMHIRPWLDMNTSLELIPFSDTINRQSTSKGHSAIPNGVPVALTVVVDKMLVGIQQLRQTLDGLPKTSDEVGWLSRSDLILIKAMKGMQLSKITDEIKIVVEHNIACMTSDNLNTACALSIVLLPLIQQYRNCFNCIFNRHLEIHSSTCRLARVLSEAGKEIFNKGFCTPKEPSNEKQESGKTEEGTGLGDGEGMEDISKDIQDDEDLSELAEGGTKQQDQNEKALDPENDAIDMEDEKMEGTFDDEAQHSDTGEKDEKDEDEEDSMSEEVGEVDELDPSAVDEKLWSGKAEDDEHEKEGKTNGQKGEGDLAAQNNEKKDEDEDKIEQEKESFPTDNDDPVGLPPDGKPEEEKDVMNPHVDEEENLELPDDIEMENAKHVDQESDEDLMDELSGISEADEQDLKDSITDDDDDDDDAMTDTNNPNQDNFESSNSVDQCDDSMSLEDTNQAEPHEIENSPILQQQDVGAREADDGFFDDVRGTGQDNAEDDDQHEQCNDDVRNTGAVSIENLMQHDEQQQKSAQTGGTGQPTEEADLNQGDRDDTGSNAPQMFRKLGEALEKWHRSNKEIQQASNDDEQNVNDSKAEPDDGAEFEHLRDEDDDAHAQVLSAAMEHEIRALDLEEQNMEVDIDVMDQSESNALDVLMQEDTDANDLDIMREQFTREQITTTFPNQDLRKSGIHEDRARTQEEIPDESDVEEIGEDLSEVRLNNKPSRSLEAARLLWSHFEQTTRDLSISLTEQLRLILAPSMATKMRGDFKTGKRLNMKRIIPYIASQYKRDKIWMRRSIPSKRNYQVMLAMDDSKSMSESGSSRLAFETLTLLSRSLTMLEVGQICIASFGEDFKVAHNFENSFSTDSAIRVFQHFSFAQSRTNVRRLISESLQVFREARSRQASSGVELWQLQLIISDGVCEDHELIKRLTRQAHEERIMIVFAIIDAAGSHSILNMTQASFDPDENGESKLKIKRYLDGFPFAYYLIVGDVKNLPGVLATALRQWFAEVVEGT